MIDVKSCPFMVLSMMFSYSPFETLSFTYRSIEVEKLYKIKAHRRNRKWVKHSEISNKCAMEINVLPRTVIALSKIFF